MLLDLSVAETCRFYKKLLSYVHCGAAFVLVMRKLVERNCVTLTQACILSLSPKELFTHLYLPVNETVITPD